MYLRWLGVYCLVCGRDFFSEHFVSVLGYFLWSGLRAEYPFAFSTMYLLSVVLTSLMGFPRPHCRMRNYDDVVCLGYLVPWYWVSKLWAWT